MNTQTTPELLKPAPVALQPVVRRAVALSIRQPWAWLIIHACKDVENRDWPTRVRGRAARARSTALACPPERCRMTFSFQLSMN